MVEDELLDLDQLYEAQLVEGDRALTAEAVCAAMYAEHECVEFRDCDCPEDFDLGGCETDPGGAPAHTVRFVDCRFQGRVSFSHMQFEAITFQGVQFQGMAFFNDATFESAHFDECRFEQLACFDNAVFGGPSYFDSARFCEMATFHNTRFGEAASFDHTRFGVASFVDATFDGLVSFGNARFDEHAAFDRARFNREAYFTEAQFRGEASYVEAVFTRGADFRLVRYWPDTLAQLVRHLLLVVMPGSDVLLWKADPATEEPIPRALTRALLPRHDCPDGKPTHMTTFYSDSTAIDEVGNAHFNRHVADQQYVRAFLQRHRMWAIVWRLSSDYGRSLGMWAIWTVLLSLLYGAVFASIPDAFDIPPEAPGAGLFTMWYYSVITFTTLGFGDIAPLTTLARVLTMCEVGTGYVMLGGLISILANKLARRS